MTSQKGSVLAGVLAISLALTIAASGFISIVGDKSNQETSAITGTQVLYAAESGMLMGLRWARTYSFAKVDDPGFAPDLVLTPGTDGFRDMDGVLVKVRFLSGGLGVHTMQSFATLGAHQDTVELNWQMNHPGDHSPMINLNLDRWTETFHPGK